MPSWIYYLSLFMLGAGGNLVIAYFCNMEKGLPLGASIAFGIILGLAIGLGYIDGRIDRED